MMVYVLFSIASLMQGTLSLVTVKSVRQVPNGSVRVINNLEQEVPRVRREKRIIFLTHLFNARKLVEYPIYMELIIKVELPNPLID
jgi:hypothetical protein